MSKQERNGFSVRFRKIDFDLKEATKDLDEGAISELARNGLRLMLGIRTAKQIQITEKLITLPSTLEQTRTTQLVSKPAVFIPKRN
jgi:hypothetical protein